MYTVPALILVVICLFKREQEKYRCPHHFFAENPKQFSLLRRHKCEICYPPPPVGTDVSGLFCSASHCREGEVQPGPVCSLILRLAMRPLDPTARAVMLRITRLGTHGVESIPQNIASLLNSPGQTQARRPPTRDHRPLP